MKAVEILNCQIGNVSTTADRGLSIRFRTPEVSPEAAAVLIGLNGLLATVAIVPDGARETVRGSAQKQGRTPSQRLRAVLYRRWEQEGRAGDAEGYYERAMEGIIEGAKRGME